MIKRFVDLSPYGYAKGKNGNYLLAGPGELSLHCVGPRGKTAYCELNDHQDGTFTLNLKPQVCKVQI